ncbi:MAG TPA: DUF6265 family protein [Planctomycetota bacterium]|nr:DUF6265 family protein [Planctomycetota bacterium]
MRTLFRCLIPFVLAGAAAAQDSAGAPPAAKPAAPKRPAFTGHLTCVLQVRDLDRAIAWYGDVLGMRLLWKSDEIGFAEVRTATGDVNLGLARHDEPRVEPGVVLTFGVRDVAAAEAALRTKQVETGPVDVYPDLVKLLPFADPDGNRLQFFESLQQPPRAHAGLEAVAFLAGSWVHEDGDGRQEEHWTAPNGGMMLGMARTVRAGKAVGFEHLRIERKGDEVVYHASPQGREPTPFTLQAAESRPGRVVFANPDNDFPKRITYWLDEEGKLHARIDGGDERSRAVEFVWRRGGLR